MSDPPLIADRVMRNFFVANYSQTNVHYGEIQSLPYLIYKDAENMELLKNDIETALGKLLRGYFESVDVNVEIKNLEEEVESVQNITIDVVVQSGLNRYSLGRLIYLANGRISKIEEF